MIPVGQSHDGDEFGAAMVAADLDLDGKDELIVGAPGDIVDGDRAGGVFIFKSNGTEMNAWRRLRQVDGGLGAEEDGDEYGAAVAVAFVDTDHYLDVLVGAPGEDIGSGSSKKVDAGHVFQYATTPSGSHPALGDGAIHG